MKMRRRRQRAVRRVQEDSEDAPKGITASVSQKDAGSFAVETIVRVMDLGREVGGTQNLKKLVDVLA
jgi:hypothetical protein